MNWIDNFTLNFEIANQANFARTDFVYDLRKFFLFIMVFIVNIYFKFHHFGSIKFHYFKIIEHYPNSENIIAYFRS